MGNVQIECTKADLYWMHCQICGTDGPRTEDLAEAERQRVEHRRMHAAMSETGHLPAGTILYRCSLPACEWMHPQLPPTEAEIIAAWNVPVAEAVKSRLLDIEAVIRAHLETHALLEWVQEITRLRDEASAATMAERKRCVSVLREQAGNYGITAWSRTA